MVGMTRVGDGVRNEIIMCQAVVGKTMMILYEHIWKTGKTSLSKWVMSAVVVGGELRFSRIDGINSALSERGLNV